MATVFEVRPNYDYQTLEPVDSDAYLRERKEGSWQFNGTPIRKRWTPLECYVRQPILPAPDIWKVGRTFAFEERAVDVLVSCLEKAGELLPLRFEGRVLFVLNVTYAIECLDKEKSDFDPELPHIISKYAFHKDRLDYPLFKIPQNTNLHFTVVGLAEPTEELKPLIEQHNLTGLSFLEVWSSGEKDD